MHQRFFAAIAALSLFLQPAVAFAQMDSRGFLLDAGFDPNLILTDEDLFDTAGMTKARLISFLDSKGALADTRVRDIDGEEKSAPDVIWRVVHTYKINPKFLLALLQKEQSLVEDDSPSQRQLDWATGFGVCDACSKDDPRIQDYKGFANQLEYAAKQMREKNLIRLLSTGKTLSGAGPGKTMTIDGVAVTPVNMATASLYTYTPHIHGNMNLWRIWKRWFTRNFTDGTVVRGKPSGDLFWIRNGLKRPFESNAVAASLVDTTKVVEVSDTELTAYEDGAAIAFPNYALLKDPAGRIWLLVGSQRRHIVNMVAFQKFSFNSDEVEEVTDEDLVPYEVGEPITPDTQYPRGTLLKDATSKDVWYVENGIRQLITSPALLSLYFKNRTPKSVKSSVLTELEIGNAYRLRDGELVKSSAGPAVYVIEFGKRRPILSGDTFEELGWKWKNVVTLPEKFLAEYDMGAPVTTETSPVQLAQN